MNCDVVVDDGDDDNDDDDDDDDEENDDDEDDDDDDDDDCDDDDDDEDDDNEDEDEGDEDKDKDEEPSWRWNRMMTDVDEILYMDRLIHYVFQKRFAPGLARKLCSEKKCQRDLAGFQQIRWQTIYAVTGCWTVKFNIRAR